MGRGKSSGVMAVATRSHTPVITKDELQRVLPEHLKVTGVEEGTVIGFLEQDARDDNSWSRPITPDTDQAAVKVSLHTHARNYQGKHPSYVSSGLYTDLHRSLPADVRIYEDYHIHDTYGDDPQMAIEHLEVGSRGAVDYTVVLFRWPNETI